MKTARLVAISDEYDSAPGLVLKDQPRFDGLMAAREGLLIAHDILEHQNGARCIGSVWDELEALGALWQVRGRHGDLLQDRPNIRSPQTNIASDVTRMFQDWLNDQDHGPGPETQGRRACEADDAFRQILDIAERDIPRESGGDWDAEQRAALPVYLALALRRMRIGYRKAARKYGHGFEGYEMMRRIRDALRQAVKPEFEGQEFVLHYSPTRAFVEEIYQ